MAVATSRTRGRAPAVPVVRAAPSHQTTPEERIEGAFRQFRESAVHLVEQVNDEMELLHGPEDTSDADLHLTRAVFGKWSADILLVLHRTPTAGFEDLRRSLGSISARILSIKLKDLEEIGVVTREIVDARPPRVRYSLTERGWTVAWLAQPIVLYLRATDRTIRGLSGGLPVSAPERLESVPSKESAPRPGSARRAPSRR
jgi:DNA-binding HxlR family transcriptional regulator